MMLVLVSVFFGLQYFRAKTNPQTASPNSAASAPQSAATSGAQPAAQPTAPASVSTPQVRKPFVFDETYVLHADVEVTRNGAPIRALVSWPGGFGDQDNASAYNGAQFDSSINGKDEHLAFKKVSGGATVNGPFDWVAVSDPFFAAPFLPY